MKRTIIHIQKNDDITSIIDKLKQVKSEVVAVVADKGSTVMNSSVNIKLINKAAKKAKLKLILVSASQAVEKTASAESILVSKDLDARPVIPNIPVVKSSKEISIDQNKSQARPTKKKPEDASATQSDQLKEDAALQQSAPDKSSKRAFLKRPKSSEKVARKGIAIPNFNNFRNKAIAGFVGLLSIILLWVVMFKVLPKAKVLVQIQTSKIKVSESIFLANTFNDSDFSKNEIRSQKSTVNRELTKKFTPSGKKQVGDKSTGTVTVANKNSTTTENFQAGTKFTDSAGLVFVSDAAFSVGPASVSGGQVQSGAPTTVPVTAESAGTEYNLSSGVTLEISGSTGFFDTIGGGMTGGTSKEVSIVTQADVDSVVQELSQPGSEEVTAELERAFAKDVVVFDDTYSVVSSNAQASPSVGEEALEGEVKVQLSYSLHGVEKQTLIDFAKAKTDISDENQNVYSVDATSVSAKAIKQNADNIEVELNIDSFVGPSLDEDKIKELSTAKGYSQIIDDLGKLEGVFFVDVEFSPFYVGKAPGTSKIDVDIKIDDKNASTQADESN